MNDNLLHIVTGAFGYCGKYITKPVAGAGAVRTNVDQFAPAA